MAHVSVRMTDEEKELLESYAKLHNKSVTVVLKDSFFEKLEDEIDIRAVEEYEKTKEAESFTSFEQMVRELDLADEIL
ncbi:type II toxin-antitoxin system RelB family antitoxin [Enterococcus sp. AZ177]|uniref:type II toxin-antitoxin system RelB family antitoxin n=1 Tax=unclassified Enterococcus TaxID=2608891 RepID=UPI003D300AA1